MINSQSNLEEFSNNILAGVRKAVQQLVEKSAANNETLVIGDKDGKVKIVPAKELLATVNKPQ